MIDFGAFWSVARAAENLLKCCKTHWYNTCTNWKPRKRLNWAPSIEQLSLGLLPFNSDNAAAAVAVAAILGLDSGAEATRLCH